MHQATRSWNRPHTKATVVVACDDGSVHTLGGARAARCNYAIVYMRADGSWGVLGLRSAPRAESGYSGRQEIVQIEETESC